MLPPPLLSHHAQRHSFKAGIKSAARALFFSGVPHRDIWDEGGAIQEQAASASRDVQKRSSAHLVRVPRQRSRAVTQQEVRTIPQAIRLAKAISLLSQRIEGCRD